MTLNSDHSFWRVWTEVTKDSYNRSLNSPIRAKVVEILTLFLGKEYPDNGPCCLQLLTTANRSRHTVPGTSPETVPRVLERVNCELGITYNEIIKVLVERPHFCFLCKIRLTHSLIFHLHSSKDRLGTNVWWTQGLRTFGTSVTYPRNGPVLKFIGVLMRRLKLFSSVTKDFLFV